MTLERILEEREKVRNSPQLSFSEYYENLTYFAGDVTLECTGNAEPIFCMRNREKGVKNAQRKGGTEEKSENPLTHPSVLVLLQQCTAGSVRHRLLVLEKSQQLVKSFSSQNRYKNLTEEKIALIPAKLNNA